MSLICFRFKTHKHVWLCSESQSPSCYGRKNWNLHIGSGSECHMFVGSSMICTCQMAVAPHLALALQLITMTVCILVAEDALVNVSEVMPDPHESAGTASFTSVGHRLELIAGHWANHLEVTIGWWCWPHCSEPESCVHCLYCCPQWFEQARLQSQGSWQTGLERVIDVLKLHLIIHPLVQAFRTKRPPELDSLAQLFYANRISLEKPCRHYS